MTSHGRILIVDDEPDLRLALNRTLRALGFEIAEASNGEQALARVEHGRFHAALLDINMPGIGGIEACRRIRRIAPNLQILMLTVRESESDKVKALDAGADDYITKPFSIAELAARLRSAVRRVETNTPDLSAPIRIGAIQLDPARRTVSKDKRPVHLTPKAFDLLHYLMANPGIPLTHARLLRAVWGAEYGLELEYLRTFVHQLRHRLEDDPASPEYLLTETGIGYRFREPSG